MSGRAWHISQLRFSDSTLARILLVIRVATLERYPTPKLMSHYQTNVMRRLGLSSLSSPEVKCGNEGETRSSVWHFHRHLQGLNDGNDTLFLWHCRVRIVARKK